MTIHFKMNDDKAIEALVWLANKQRGITPFYVSKVLYYADKEHLNRYGRPILGDTYFKLEWGPVPTKIYDVIKKNEPKNIDRDFLKKFKEAVEVRGGFVHLYPRRKPNLELFSQTDIKCLTNSLKEYGKLNFGILSDMSHKESAWKNAQENEAMAYEDMIEKSPKQKKIIKDLKEHSHQIVF